MPWQESAPPTAAVVLLMLSLLNFSSVVYMIFFVLLGYCCCYSSCDRATVSWRVTTGEAMVFCHCVPSQYCPTRGLNCVPQFTDGDVLPTELFVAMPGVEGRGLSLSIIHTFSGEHCGYKNLNGPSALPTSFIQCQLRAHNSVDVSEQRGRQCSQFRYWSTLLYSAVSKRDWFTSYALV